MAITKGYNGPIFVWCMNISQYKLNVMFWTNERAPILKKFSLNEDSDGLEEKMWCLVFTSVNFNKIKLAEF